MPTKEEILNKFMDDDRTRESIYQAIEEFANHESKIKSIEFVKWKDQRFRYLPATKDYYPIEQGRKSFKDIKTLTAEELYDLFIEQSK